MPFHFCADEMLMLMAMIPFIGIFFRRLHVWWHSKFNHKCHHVTPCQEHHVDHVHDTKPGYLTREDMDEEIKNLSKETFDE